MALQQIGVVSTRSGILTVIDTGLLNLWSHDRSPEMPTGILDSDEDTARANSFVDVKVVGRDALAAGRLLDRSWHPGYVYDQPPDHAELQQKFGQVILNYKLDARLEVAPDRIPHRQRVDLALQYGEGGGEVQFHGLSAVAVNDVPVHQDLRIMGRRLAGPDGDRWKEVLVECRPNLRAVSSQIAGMVMVDWARLMIVDVDALAIWQHERSLDGLADYVFWGRDAEDAARVVAAPPLQDELYGWLDLPEDVAQERGQGLEQYRDQRGLSFQGDYCPHSHHWLVMRESRTSPTESGTVDLSDVTACNFMTTWGDGLFEVYRDLDDAGKLVQIRIEMEQVPLPE